MALASHPTSSTSQKLGTVGFPNVDPLHEEVKHTAIAPVEIHLKLAALEPREQSGADVPTPLKRKPVAIRDVIAMSGGLATLGLHEQQLEIIGRSKTSVAPRSGPPPVRHPHSARLSSKLIPGLLVIIHDGLNAHNALVLPASCLPPLPPLWRHAPHSWWWAGVGRIAGSSSETTIPRFLATSASPVVGGWNAQYLTPSLFWFEMRRLAPAPQPASCGESVPVVSRGAWRHQRSVPELAHPDRRFHQGCRPSRSQATFHLFDTGNLSRGPASRGREGERGRGADIL
jgi:hypothetical protein